MLGVGSMCMRVVCVLGCRDININEYLYIYIYIYMCVCVCVCVFVFVFVFVRLRVYEAALGWVCVLACACMYMCVRREFYYSLINTNLNPLLHFSFSSIILLHFLPFEIEND